MRINSSWIQLSFVAVLLAAWIGSYLVIRSTRTLAIHFHRSASFSTVMKTVAVLPAGGKRKVRCLTLVKQGPWASPVAEIANIVYWPLRMIDHTVTDEMPTFIVWPPN